MEDDSKTDGLLRQYLLGNLPEDGQQSVEERLMTDTAFCELLQIAEEELADEYASGAIRGSEKESFERLFLNNPRRRQQVAFARALRRYAATASPERGGENRQKLPWSDFLTAFLNLPAPFKSALAAGCAIVIISGVWLAIQVGSLQKELHELLSQQSVIAKDRQTLTESMASQQQRLAQLEEELAKTSAKGSVETAANNSVRRNLIALSLFPGLARGSGVMPRLAIPAGTDRVRLELVLENEAYQSYEAELRTAENSTTWRQSGIHSSKRSGVPALIVELPATALQPQDYILKLYGRNRTEAKEDAGSYYFRVSAK